MDNLTTKVGRLTEVLPPVRCTPALKALVGHGVNSLGTNWSALQRLALIHLLGTPEDSAQAMAKVIRKKAQTRELGGAA